MMLELLLLLILLLWQAEKDKFGVSTSANRHPAAVLSLVRISPRRGILLQFLVVRSLRLSCGEQGGGRRKNPPPKPVLDDARKEGRMEVFLLSKKAEKVSILSI
jgi:hypothetical protein